MTSKRAYATLIGVLLSFAACAPTRPLATAPAPAAPRNAVMSLDLGRLLGEETAAPETSTLAARRDILGSATYDLPMVANSLVEAELDFLVEERREVVARWLAKGDYYEKFIESVLRSTGVPTDLYHLAMIESGFVAAARSRVGAVGFWQFMPPTAKDLGLRMDDAVDERMDPVRSTRAAARHLKYLRGSLGDWSLAAAAYNAGSGRIGRGLKSAGATDFWELSERGDLATETKKYVPRLFAITVIGRDRERFGFGRATAGSFAYDSILVEYATPLAELARLGDVTVRQLADLNPHLLKQTTPSGSYWVWVPEGKGATLQRAWLASDFRKYQGYGTYTIRAGDTLGELAKLGDMSLSLIRELNESVNVDQLKVGEKLRLPYKAAQQLGARAVRRADDEPKVAASTAARADRHAVTRGETLSEIALRYGVTVAQLLALNEMEGTAIRIGQELRIPAPASSETRAAARTENAAQRAGEKAEHLVKSGDSLWSIANAYGSSVVAIQDANELGNRPIRPGQKLTVPILDRS